MDKSDFFDIDFGELDFDLDDFDLDTAEPDETTRILHPRIDRSIITQTLTFKHAMEFAENIDLSGETRTFAWIGGGFIFGDIVEALWRVRHVDIKNLTICTLSISEENIDSWAGLLQQADPPIERFDLVCSAYFYSHEKFGMIPILYDRINDDRFQVAFGAYHMKMICIETHHGHTLVIHGSANTRSSYNVEQIMCEVGNRELYDFNVDALRQITDQFGTINSKAPKMTRKETREFFDRMRKER